MKATRFNSTFPRISGPPLVRLIEIIHTHTYITKTRPCNEHPLTPHLYIIKLGLTGVYLLSYFCSKTKIVGTRQNRLTEAVLTCTHNQCFEQKLFSSVKIPMPSCHGNKYHTTDEKMHNCAISGILRSIFATFVA